jgi:tetratricopeptide (TPR) repeat protein
MYRMFHAAMASAVVALVVVAAISSSATLAAAVPESSTNAPSEERTDQRFQELWRRYELEGPRLRRPGQEASLEHWESQFKKSLDGPKGNSWLRLRIMDALGDTQMALGKQEEALETFLRMEEYAESVGNQYSQVDAQNSQLDLLASKPTETIMKAADRLELSAEKFVDEQDDLVAHRMYVTVLAHIGARLTTCAMAEDHAAHSERLLKRAEAVLEKAIASADQGSTPAALPMYWLAQSQSLQGRGTEAAETYRELVGMPEIGFSRLWLEHLRICETTKRDSAEYRAAIEQALADHGERGGTDTYELTLRRMLGRSYRRAEEYAKSSEILTSVFEQGDDPDAKAHDMLLLAQNARDLKDVSAASRMLKEAAARYPHTGAGQTALAELQKPKYRRFVVSEQRDTRSWAGVIIGTHLVAIVILLIVLVRRQMKSGTRATRDS